MAESHGIETDFSGRGPNIKDKGLHPIWYRVKPLYEARLCGWTVGINPFRLSSPEQDDECPEENRDEEDREDCRHRRLARDEHADQIRSDHAADSSEGCGQSYARGAYLCRVQLRGIRIHAAPCAEIEEGEADARCEQHAFGFSRSEPYRTNCR